MKEFKTLFRLELKSRFGTKGTGKPFFTVLKIGVVLALVAAVVWVLLPIDLVPDSLPFLGMLDDVTVAIFSGIVLRNSVEGHVQRRQ